MPIKNETGQVAVMLAGEPLVGQTVIAELRRSGHAFDSSSASYIAHIYEERHQAFLDVLHGGFAGFLIDAREQTCLLFNDRYALKPVYYLQEADRFLFASEAKALIAVSRDARKLDTEGLGQFLTYGCTFGERTLFSVIKRLPGAAAWRLGRRRPVERRQYFSPHEWEDAAAGDALFTAEEFDVAFEAALERCRGGSAPIGLSLTGGLDTRLILACYGQTNSLLAYTFGGRCGDTVDIEIAKRLAASCSLKHEVLRLGHDFFTDFPTHATRTVHDSDGTTSVRGTHEHYLNALARQVAPVRLTGNYGSEIFHGVNAVSRLLPDETLFAPHVISSMNGAHETIADERRCHPVTFAAFKAVPWSIAPSVAVADAHVSVRTPYIDADLVPMAYRRRPALEASRVVQELIRIHNGALASIPTDRGLKIGTPTASILSEMTSRVSFKADYLLGDDGPDSFRKLRWLKSVLPWTSHKYLFYGEWFQRECRDFVLDILTDTRTVQREYLSGLGVQRLTESFHASANNRLAEINSIMTLELMQRSADIDVDQ